MIDLEKTNKVCRFGVAEHEMDIKQRNSRHGFHENLCSAILISCVAGKLFRI